MNEQEKLEILAKDLAREFLRSPHVTDEFLNK
jgi:hypothetical protein